jgi:hypothetical protein
MLEMVVVTLRFRVLLAAPTEGAISLRQTLQPASYDPLSKQRITQDAFAEDLPHQAGACQEGKAEQTYSSLDQVQDQQQDSLQRKEAPLEAHQAGHLS